MHGSADDSAPKQPFSLHQFVSSRVLIMPTSVAMMRTSGGQSVWFVKWHPKDRWPALDEICEFLRWSDPTSAPVAAGAAETMIGRPSSRPTATAPIPPMLAAERSPTGALKVAESRTPTRSDLVLPDAVARRTFSRPQAAHDYKESIT